jgi:hypothetical protein
MNPLVLLSPPIVPVKVSVPPGLVVKIDTAVPLGTKTNGPGWAWAGPAVFAPAHTMRPTATSGRNILTVLSPSL